MAERLKNWSWHTLEAKTDLISENETNRAQRHCQIGLVIGKPMKLPIYSGATFSRDLISRFVMNRMAL